MGGAFAELYNNRVGESGIVAWNTAWAVRLPNRCASTKAGCEMIIFDEDRPSDSPFVERIWRCHSEGAAPFLSIAASRCELVVSRLQGKVTMTVRGPETRATPMLTKYDQLSGEGPTSCTPSRSATIAIRASRESSAPVK